MLIVLPIEPTEHRCGYVNSSFFVEENHFNECCHSVTLRCIIVNILGNPNNR